MLRAAVSPSSDPLPRPTFERLWFAYVAVVCVVTITCAHDLAWSAIVGMLGTHAVVAAAAFGTRHLAVHRSPAAARWPRAALGIVGLPTVFSAVAWLLPAVHPEPFEYVCLAWDRALFGGDPAVLLHDWLPPLVIEILQLTYACFYALPIVAAIAALRGSGHAAFDRAVLWCIGGFLASYLGYLLVPTLGPKVILAYEHPVRGVWLTETVRAAIDAGEANPWDCFPSGHTWLAITSLLVVWRWNRRWFWVLLLPAVVLIASTVLLRYHFFVDVVAGALAAYPFARLCDWLADRDGWPRPAP